MPLRGHDVNRYRRTDRDSCGQRYRAAGSDGELAESGGAGMGRDSWIYGLREYRLDFWGVARHTGQRGSILSKLFVTSSGLPQSTIQRLIHSDWAFGIQACLSIWAEDVRNSSGIDRDSGQDSPFIQLSRCDGVVAVPFPEVLGDFIECQKVLLCL